MRPKNLLPTVTRTLASPRLLALSCWAAQAVIACASPVTDMSRAVAGGGGGASAAGAGSRALAGGFAVTAGHAGSTESNPNADFRCRPLDRANTGEFPRPEGIVESCFGAACPRGACETGLFNGPRCNTVYPEPWTRDAVLCPSGASGAYCLSVATDRAEAELGHGRLWFVTCVNGIETSPRFCPCSCVAYADEAAKCGP